MEVEIPDNIQELRNRIFGLESDIEFWGVAGASELDLMDIRDQKRVLVKELDKIFGL